MSDVTQASYWYGHKNICPDCGNELRIENRGGELMVTCDRGSCYMSVEWFSISDLANCYIEVQKLRQSVMIDKIMESRRPK